MRFDSYPLSFQRIDERKVLNDAYGSREVQEKNTVLVLKVSEMVFTGIDHKGTD